VKPGESRRLCLGDRIQQLIHGVCAATHSSLVPSTQAISRVIHVI
jgi:hypothetical protein